MDFRQEGFDEETVVAIGCLTKRDGEAYMDYLDRVKPNPLAVQVMLADLADNLDPMRTPLQSHSMESVWRATTRLGLNCRS